jgi:magnesium transporter
VASRTDHAIARALAEGHPADAARVLERFGAAQSAAVLAGWAPQPAAVVLEQMMADLAAACLAHLSEDAARETLDPLDLDSVTAILRRADPGTRTALLAGMEEDRRRPLERLLAHAEGTAGALMDALVADLPDDIAAQAALERVRGTPRAPSYVYVVDRRGRLLGVLSLHELLQAAPSARLASLMRSPVMRLHADDDRDAIVAHPGWNEFHALPVVDAEGRLLGVVRYETLRRLDAEARSRRGERAVSVAVSLGELYWMGLSGLVEGLGQVALRSGGPGEVPDER